MARRRRKNRKALKIALFLVLLIVAGVICFLVWQSYFSGENNNTEESVEVEQTEEVKKDNGVEDEKKVIEESRDEEVVEKEKVVQYEGENPNKQEELTGVVTYAGVNNGVLMVRVNIDQYISGGRCNLVLRQNGVDVYGASAEIIASVATSTCDGFEVPVSNIGVGDFDIVINLNANGKTGVIRGGVNI